MRAKVLVTGAAGFLGRNLSSLLLEEDIDVIGIDNMVTGSPDLVDPRVLLIKGDIREYIPDIPELLAVFHCAAIARSTWSDDLEVMSTNFTGTKKVLDYAVRHNAPLIHSSSSMAAVPEVNIYALSKWLGEREVLREDRIHTVALRYGNIYGSGQSQEGAEPNVLAAWVRSYNERGWVRLDGDGSQTRDFIHVDDVARANYHAYLGLSTFSDDDLLSAIGATEPIDICTGEQTPLSYIAHDLLDVPTKPGERRFKDPDSLPQDPGPATLWPIYFRADHMLEDFIDDIWN